MKKALLVLAVLVGFSASLQAQELPVQVLCFKGSGSYKPICNQVKKAVNGSSQFRQARSGNRYVVILGALTGNIQGGDVDMSVMFGAVLSDPLSQVFPYQIVTIPLVFSPSESSIVAEGLISVFLPIAVAAFSAVVDDINSSGPSGRELSEATVDDILEKMQFEMDRLLKEQTN